LESLLASSGIIFNLSLSQTKVRQMLSNAVIVLGQNILLLEICTALIPGVVLAWNRSPICTSDALI